MSWRDILSALLGVSAYQPPKGYGPDLRDPAVERIREQVGGNLALQPTTRTRWYLADLEAARVAADTGDLSTAAQLCASMRGDGLISGLLGTLTGGLVTLPKKFYGSHKESIEALQARNGSRSVFDDMAPTSELALLAADGVKLGVGIAELVPVPGRDFPIMIRLEPEFLRYRWVENRWYYLSIAGPLPITPGDGRWVLHAPGGRVRPWMAALWPSLGRSYINKEHAFLHRSNYSGKLANPARAAVAPAAATEPQRTGLLASLLRWGTNTVIELPPGWDVKIIESKGEGYQVFQSEIDTCDNEIKVAIAGQVVTVDGGAGFQNSDIHRTIRADIIKHHADGLAYTLNTQLIPPYVASHWGAEAVKTGACIEWDISRPKDLDAEARSLLTAAQAIDQLRATLATFGRELDIDELATRYGIPIRGDVDGDGAPDDAPAPTNKPGASPEPASPGGLLN